MVVKADINVVAQRLTHSSDALDGVAQHLLGALVSVIIRLRRELDAFETGCDVCLARTDEIIAREIKMSRLG